MQPNDAASQFDRELDRLATNGRRDSASSGEVASLLSAAETLRARDAADRRADTNPEFLHRLEELLDMNPPTEMISVRPAAVGSLQLVALEPRAIRTQRRGGAFALLEFAAAALLLFVLAAAAYGGGAFNRFLSQVVTPIPAATANVAGMYRGDAGRTGAVPGVGPIGVPSLVWKTPVSGAINNPPVVAGDKIFFIERDPTTGRGVVTCLDAKTGQKLWSRQAGAVPDSAPAVGNNLVFVLTPIGLTALNVDSGAFVWTYDAGRIVTGGSPAFANGLVYFSTSDLSLRAVNANTGQEAWRAALPHADVGDANAVDSGSRGPSSPAVGGGIIVAEGGNGYVMAANAKDGHELWRLRAGDRADLMAVPVISDGVVYLSASDSGPNGGNRAANGMPRGHTWALDLKTGASIWQREDASPSLSLAVDGDTVYLSPGGAFGAYNAKSGALIWSFEIEGPMNQPLVTAEAVYARTLQGRLYGLNKNSGTRVWEAYTGVANDPIVADGTIIVIGRDSISAIGGDSSAALPASGDPTLDVSGLPPCSPWRSGPLGEIGGTPSATLDAPMRLPNLSGALFREILIKNLPSGPPASASDLAGIEETLQKLAACANRPEAAGKLIGFYTGDYFRRITASGGQIDAANKWPLTGNRVPVVVSSTVMLPDRRIAALAMDSATPGTLLIFAKQDGHWLIDERYQVVAAYTQDGPG